MLPASFHRDIKPAKVVVNGSRVVLN